MSDKQDLVARWKTWSTDSLGRRVVIGDIVPIGDEMAAEIERLRALVCDLLENDPDDMAADGVTVLDAWRKAANETLQTKNPDA